MAYYSSNSTTLYIAGSVSAGLTTSCDGSGCGGPGTTTKASEFYGVVAAINTSTGIAVTTCDYDGFNFFQVNLSKDTLLNDINAGNCGYYMLLTGASHNGVNYKAFTFRMNLNANACSVDGSYGTSGVYYYSEGNSDNFNLASSVDSSTGKFVVTGRQVNMASNGVWRPGGYIRSFAGCGSTTLSKYLTSCSNLNLPSSGYNGDTSTPTAQFTFSDNSTSTVGLSNLTCSLQAGSRSGDTFTAATGTGTNQCWADGAHRFSCGSVNATFNAVTVPNAPTNLAGTAGVGQVALSWTAPSSNGSAISNYYYKYSSDNGNNWSTPVLTGSSSANYTVTGLTNGTSYIFQVAAVNGVGTGSYSSSSASVTLPTTPGTPTNLVGTFGNALVSLTWTAPTSNGGNTITNYYYKYSSDNGNNWSTPALTGSSSASYTVTGLTNGTSYIFQVAAVNGVGTGSYSSSSASVTPATTPGAPTITSVTPGNQMASVFWTAPASTGGSAITDYVLQYSSDNGSTWSSFTHTASTDTRSYVTGLTNGTSYIFKVAETNIAGTGSYSANSSAVTPSGTFISQWNTNNTSTGSSSSTQVALPLTSTGSYNFTVNWGDGTSNTITTWNDSNKTHTYAAAGTYTLNITGTITGFYFNNSGDRLKLTQISQWGSLKLGTTEGSYFYGAANLTVTATDLLDLTGTTSLLRAFSSCTSLTTVPSMNSWNTSSVTHMGSLFQSASVFNQDIGSWNTSNVTTLGAMFNSAAAFNQNIGSWNTSKVNSLFTTFQGATVFNNGGSSTINNWDTSAVTDMSYLFTQALAFNQNIGSWNTAKVTSMGNMFWSATAFNQNIGSWNTVNVTSMGNMFNGATAFNQNIGSWNTAKVTNMGNMFSSATAFNQNIGSWNTSNVTDMSTMFYNDTVFDQDLGSWNVSKVTSMFRMFWNASKFNNGGTSNINNWNTSAVTNMGWMFNGATLFNQNIGSWDTSRVTAMSVMFLSAKAFNQNIGSWNTILVNDMTGMFNGASAFNQNIGSWNTAAVTNMYQMFTGASVFNQNIGNWNTAKVTNMASMFQSATAFNQNISIWSSGNTSSSTIGTGTCATLTHTAFSYLATALSAANKPCNYSGSGW